MSPIETRSSAPFVLAVLALGALLFATGGGISAFLASRQDALAAQNSQRMMQGGIESLRSSVELLAGDYSRWDSAVERIATRDTAWIYDNMALTVEEDNLDLFVIAPPDGAQLGWEGGSDGEVRAARLDAELLALLRERKADMPYQKPVTFFTEMGAELYILSAIHVQPWEYDGDGADRPDAPLLVYGLEVTQARLEKVAARYYIDGVRLVRDPPPAERPGDIVLSDSRGDRVALVRWEMPTPGTDVLRAWAPAGAALALAGLILTGMILAYVTRSASALRRALEQARDSDRAKSVLLANVSHELRTPLNGIIGASQLLEDSDIGPEDREMTDIIRDSANALLVLIEDLIQVAWVDSGEIAVRPVPVDVAAFLEDAAAGPRILANQKGLTLGVGLEGDVPMIRADARLLRQALVNLLGNAVKFTEAGEIAVRARWEHRSPADGWLTISVQDEGIGIAPEQLDRIFDRFVQADPSSKRRHGGTGLGLSITRSLAKAMGGRVTAESTPGVGSRFTLHLPCAVEAEATIDMPKAA